MNLPNGKSKACTLHNVLYLPGLSYNLLSVSQASKKGKIVKFTDRTCHKLSKSHKLIAKATKRGSLYKLNCSFNTERVHFASGPKINQDTWHQRFGHLGLHNLQKIAREKLVKGFKFDISQDLTFCESCTHCGQHRTKFSKREKRAELPLGLAHSDLCGKINEKSLSGAEYFLSFIDDKTQYVWVYFLKRKKQVFEKFVEWKKLVEKESGETFKILRTDNGGEFIPQSLKHT